jgi:hypothetical protein
MAPAPDEESGAGVVGREESGTSQPLSTSTIPCPHIHFVIARRKEETRSAPKRERGRTPTARAPASARGADREKD